MAVNPSVPAPPGLTDHPLISHDHADQLVNDVASFEAQSATATADNALPVLQSSFALVVRAGRFIASLKGHVH